MTEKTARKGTTRRGTPLAPEARTALKHVGGPAKKRGDAAVAELLAHAFDVGEDDADAARAHVHGFHSYPARLHPVTAARLVAGLAPEKGVVLDPFCGSGTVLVESRLAGRRAVGTDVNPLAIRLAHLKVRGLPEEERRALLEAARWVEGHV
ncbi:MAG: DNA methyltransferase, partial [Polyangiales bacterium]